MDEAGTSYTWFPNGDVRTVSKTMPALVRHEGTGREMFFNSVVAALQGTDSQGRERHLNGRSRSFQAFRLRG